jgi:hypothetical protein
MTSNEHTRCQIFFFGFLVFFFRSIIIKKNCLFFFCVLLLYVSSRRLFAHPPFPLLFPSHMDDDDDVPLLPSCDLPTGYLDAKTVENIYKILPPPQFP